MQIADADQAEYCPPLDSALFAAIAADYDLSDPTSVQEAKVTLDALKESAQAEDGIDFDASGSGGHDFAQDDPQTSQTNTKTDGSTDVSQTLSGLNLADIGSETSSLDGSHEDVDLESLDHDTKVSVLKQLCPLLSEFTVSHTLTKYDDKFARTVDDLLNQNYLASTSEGESDYGISNKGIDAFSEDNVRRRGRKGKKKGTNAKMYADDTKLDPLASPRSNSASSVNQWQTATEDIDFVTLHSGLPSTLVRSAYYKNHTSVSETIAYFLRDIMKSTSRISSSDPTVQAHAVDLGREFPGVASDYLTALIRLTHPSMTSASELAKALTTKKRSNLTSSSVVPQYAALSLSDDEYEVAGMQRPRSSSPALDLLSHSTASGLAASSTANHRAVMAQAQAAYRKSRSDRLMSGAAAYYSQVGRDHAAASRGYTSAAADALVKSQSTSGQIDLHGVYVDDAVRIAKRSVETWWSNMGESRVNGRIGAADRARGFSIVTGVGKHSEGGRAKINPAVSKMLKAEGWRIENASGVIHVQGRQRGV